MHELSIAISLIDVVVEHLVHAGDDARARAVTVEVGALSGVDSAQLRTAFASAAARSEIAGCALDVVEVPVVIRCPRCDADRAAVAPNDLRCATCGATASSVVRGRELDVVAIELREDSPLSPVPGGEG